ncbi:hypothetical protein [Paraburkholderia aromaticivorans]|uniref:hypothetical protein n=1 Tax=Paraburkholderia aromaticivorans TaxID=2026199 RepID=UPI001455DFA8|nr:hypothetical protein [Paraburkholderia aromaticivorans]
MDQQTLAAEIQRAIQNDPDQVAMAVRARVDKAGAEATADAATSGHAVTVKTTVYLEDGSKNWPTTLAEMVCKTPSIAKGKAADIAARLTMELALDKPFRPSRLSKPLSANALRMVRPILSSCGYEVSGLAKGTDIVRIVRDNLRRGVTVPQTITTKFYADRVELDGRSFAYRQRDRVPTGNAWHDLSLRLTIGVAGVDVPLAAVLKLRNIGIGEFIQADERARHAASAGEAEKRATIDRPARPHPAVHRLSQAPTDAPGALVAQAAMRIGPVQCQARDIT